MLRDRFDGLMPTDGAADLVSWDGHLSRGRCSEWERKALSNRDAAVK